MRKTIFFIIILIIFSFCPAKDAKAGILDNVSGWAWSENIGWVDLNSINCDSNGNGVTDAVNYSQCPIGQTVSDYGVNINQDGILSGYAWSENIGWISFNQGDLTGCPSSPCQTSINESGKVSGWAKVLSYGGGWDGWIKFAGNGANWNGSTCTGTNNYNNTNRCNWGVKVNDSTGAFSGFAWSDMVVGWVSFNYGATTSFSFNAPPDKPTLPSESVIWLSGCTYTLAIPTINWIYSDDDNVPLGTDPQAAYQIRIDDDPTFDVDANDNAILDGNEFKCGGVVCSGGASPSFSPLTSNWISWADHNTRYYWKVRVKDSNDAWSEWSNLNSFYTPQHTYPDPDFIHTPESPSADEEVQFIDISTCYNSSNEPYSCKVNAGNRYVWDFGDGESCDSNVNSSCRGDVAHPYSELGDYTVILQITDDVGICQSQGDTPINATLPLPEYEEVPPTSFFKNFLASILEFIKNMLFS